MTEHFNPSAFIQAESSQSLAPTSKGFTSAFGMPETTVFRDNRADESETLATIATLAPVPAQKMPWDDDLIPWADGKCPPFARPVVWDELTNEALAISERWGARAIECGWSTLDLFGCYRRPWFRRLDCNGLVASIVGLLTPVRVTDLTSAHADLTDYRGNVLRHYRREKPEAVHLWEAYAMRTGP